MIEQTQERDLHNTDIAYQFYEDKYGQGYMNEWPSRKRNRVESLLRALSLPPRGRALDFGCGTAVFTEVLRNALPGWQVEGTDISTTALQIARQREPRCEFYHIDRCVEHSGQYDLVVTHHVLEHVQDIHQTASLISELVGLNGAMLHILPCGDPGSFEHWVCMQRKDSIQKEREDRFFYEEEGHLRRLTTKRLAALFTANGFRTSTAFYANQFYGAIRWLTDTNPEFIRSFTDPRNGLNTTASLRLMIVRMVLLAVWIGKRPQQLAYRRSEKQTPAPRRLFLSTACFVARPLSKVVHAILERLADYEWHRHRSSSCGSEMYVFLTRARQEGIVSGREKR